MGHVELNYVQITSAVDRLCADIENNRSEMNSSYQKLRNTFQRYDGTTADALRNLQDAENTMILNMQELLRSLAASVQSAADELKKTDQNISGRMKKYFL